MDQTLKIVHLNINSLRSVNKRQELSLFLIKHKPDILLLNETKLNNKHNISFEGYNFIRNDRPNNLGGGGTGILLKSNLQFIECSPLIFNSIECTLIRLPLRNNSEIIVAAIYVAKDMQNTVDVNDLNKILNLMTVNSSIVLGGDFNSHHTFWKSDYISTNGRLLYDWYCDHFDSHNIALSSTFSPTRHCNDSHTFLDFFFHSASLNISYEPGYTNFLTTLPFESDHDAVVLPIILNERTLTAIPNTIKNFSRINWKSFNKKIEDGINAIPIPSDRNINNNEIDEFLSSISTLLQNTIQAEAPDVIIRARGQIPLPSHIIKIINYKNKLRRTLHNLNYSNAIPNLKSQIKCLNVIIQRLISNYYEEYYESKLSNIKPDNNLYKNLKRFSSYKVKENFPNILTANNNQIFSSVEEKANGLASHFENIHKQTLSLGNNVISNQIISVIDDNFNFDNHRTLVAFNANHSANQDLTPFHPFEGSLSNTPERVVQPLQIKGQINLVKNNTRQLNFATSSEIISIARSKNNKKSFGADGISNYVLRKLSFKFYFFITLLFNHIFNNGYWPQMWKNGHVMPLLKPSKDPSRIESYRPITLLSCLSKVYESWLLLKIRAHSDDNNIIPPEQFGFRPKHSTLHALTKFSNDIAKSLNNNTPTLVCALDCEKAFDTTWIHGLVYKLRFLFGFHKHICQIIYNYLMHRTFQVKIENFLSSISNIAAGVTQGSVLAPLLYTLYISDLPKPSNININRILYADDILVYLSTKQVLGSILNNHLKQIFDHLIFWKIKLNLDKCEAIIIRGKYKNLSRKLNKNIKKVKIKINNSNVPINNSLKYLGIIFSKNFEFYKHVDNVKKNHLRHFTQSEMCFTGKNVLIHELKPFFTNN